MKNILFSNVLKKWGTDDVKSTVVKWVKPNGRTATVFHLFNHMGLSACDSHIVTGGEVIAKRGFSEPLDKEKYCTVCRRIELWLTGGK